MRRRVHYFPRPWTPRRLVRWARAVLRYARRDRPGDRRVDRRLIRAMIGHQLAILVVLRVPLLTLAFLALLPALALGSRDLAPLLENLLLDLGPGEVGVVSTVAFLTAATAVGIVNAILVNGHERLPGLPFTRWYGSPLVDVLALVAPLPLVWAVVSHARGGAGRAALAAAGGALLALILVLWARIAVLRQEPRQQRIRELENWRARPVLYPYELTIDRRGHAVTGNPLTWLAKPIWWIQDGAARARERALPGAGQRLRALGRDAEALVKLLLPRAGYVYVPPEDPVHGPSWRRPLYSTHHYGLILLAILTLVYVTLSLAKLLWMGEAPYFRQRDHVTQRIMAFLKSAGR